MPRLRRNHGILESWKEAYDSIFCSAGNGIQDFLMGIMGCWATYNPRDFGVCFAIKILVFNSVRLRVKKIFDVYNMHLSCSCSWCKPLQGSCVLLSQTQNMLLKPQTHVSCSCVWSWWLTSSLFSLMSHLPALFFYLLFKFPPFPQFLPQARFLTWFCTLRSMINWKVTSSLVVQIMSSL